MKIIFPVFKLNLIFNFRSNENFYISEQISRYNGALEEYVRFENDGGQPVNLSSSYQTDSFAALETRAKNHGFLLDSLKQVRSLNNPKVNWPPIVPNDFINISIQLSETRLNNLCTLSKSKHDDEYVSGLVESAAVAAQTIGNAIQTCLRKA